MENRTQRMNLMPYLTPDQEEKFKQTNNAPLF